MQQEMEVVCADDLALQAIFAVRTGEFVGGIDNEALDFSQLEDFINSEGSQGNNTYFSESLNSAPATTSGKLLNVIVENKRNAAGHSLPESPPDSSSEHPYSPQEGGCCGGDPITPTTISSGGGGGGNDTIYTTLGHQNIYKPTAILNNILGDTSGLLLGSHIVVASPNADSAVIDQNGGDSQLLENGGLSNGVGSGGSTTTTLLQDGRIIVNHHQADHSGLLHPDRILMQQQGHTDENSRQLLLSTTPTNNDEQQNFNDGRTTLYKTNEFVDKNHQMVHHNLGYSTHSPLEVGTSNLDAASLEQTVYANLQNAAGAPTPPTTTTTNNTSSSKKRKLSQDLTTNLLVKSEQPDLTSTSLMAAQGQLSPNSGGGNGPFSVSGASQMMDDDYASSEACLSESQYQCIKFSAFQQAQWHILCDQNLTELPVPHYRVDADKGFNFSNADDAFVCQKKNHFQITCHVQLLGDAQFVKTPEGLQKISSFHLHFYGVKHDCPTQTIRVEQSQSDRSKKAFHPVLVELVSTQVTKVTVGRLHFSETTSNNMRKKGKPNPEQRYFQLVVGLHAHTTSGNFPVISHASQKIIVRASNPGQFESDVELCWQKGQTQDSIFHSGKVGINTDRPDETLVVHGNIKVTGHIIQPSDIRAKKNIVECDPAEQLRNVQKLRVVRYDYDPTFASQLSRDFQRSDTGVIAQEVARILPEAVRPAGDLILENGTSIDNFLVVNKERIFMENIGAVKELCRVTDNLETRIDQLERINRRLNKLKRGDSLKSNSTVNSSKISHPSQNSIRCSQQHHTNNKHHHFHPSSICHWSSGMGKNPSPGCVDHEEEEFCSNKFIQIIIVILVLIMAFCLAAITVLYLLESSKHNQFVQANLQNVRHDNNNNYDFNGQQHNNQQNNDKSNNNNNNKGNKSPKNNYVPTNTWQQRNTMAPLSSNSRGRGLPADGGHRSDDITRITVDSNLIKRPFPIGRPTECLSVEQDLEHSNLCQIYCCATSRRSPAIPPPPPAPPDSGPTNYNSDKKIISSSQILVTNENNNRSNSTMPRIQSAASASQGQQQNQGQLLDLDKNKISKLFHSNDIEKQAPSIRQRRDLDLADETNSFESSDNQMFVIIIQGRSFNTTLTPNYLAPSLSSSTKDVFNYSVPISKYMPDEFVNLIFRSTQANVKEIELCHTHYEQNDDCPFISAAATVYYDDKVQIARNAAAAASSSSTNVGARSRQHKVNENAPRQSGSSVIFEVDMVDYRSKYKMYRVALKQTQNTCKLSSSKSGLEFAQYNFHFYRQCDE